MIKNGLTLELLDLRGFGEAESLDMLEAQIENSLSDDSFWIIDDKEPFHCYDYLKEKECTFETYIISENEYRIFVGSFY